MTTLPNNAKSLPNRDLFILPITHTSLQALECYHLIPLQFRPLTLTLMLAAGLSFSITDHEQLSNLLPNISSALRPAAKVA